MIPIRTDSRLRTTPWMNYGIIAANVLVFLLQHVFTRLTPMLELRPQHPTVLGFFTYSLLHANTAHIVGNMLFLYIFGNNVNDKMGHLAYLAFYVAGGIVAGIFYVLGGDQAPIIGASGAVAAVTGAYIVLFPRAQRHHPLLLFLHRRVRAPELVVHRHFLRDGSVHELFRARTDHVAHRRRPHRRNVIQGSPSALCC